MLTLHPIARPPDRQVTSDFIACGPEVSHTGTVDLPRWTPTPEGAMLLAERLARREGLRECAVRIGLWASELSALESGRETLTEGEWAGVFDAARVSGPKE